MEASVPTAGFDALAPDKQECLAVRAMSEPRRSRPRSVKSELSRRRRMRDRAATRGPVTGRIFRLCGQAAAGAG
jgi:hypothetical protein